MTENRSRVQREPVKVDKQSLHLVPVPNAGRMGVLKELSDRPPAGHLTGSAVNGT